MNVYLRATYGGKQAGQILNVRDGEARSLFGRHLASPLTETQKKRVKGLEKAREHKMVKRGKEGVKVK